MKKAILLASMVTMSGLAATPTTVLADPTFIEIDFMCPNAVGSGPQVLSRSYNMISGYGVEVVDGNPSFNSPYFQYYISSSNIPHKLTSYSNSGTDFDNITGTVSCMYSSSSGYDPFTATYVLTNGYGGQIISSTSNAISINQMVGFKH